MEKKKEELKEKLKEKLVHSYEKSRKERYQFNKFFYTAISIPLLLFAIMLFIPWIPITVDVIVLLISIIISIIVLFNKNTNKYPFHYVVDYDILIDYLKQEEQFSKENNLEAGFHFYFYQGKEKHEVMAWHFGASQFESERKKGSIYYWDEKQYSSLESLIKDKIKWFDNYVLIELIDSDSSMLNEYRKQHKDLNAWLYLEHLETL